MADQYSGYTYCVVWFKRARSWIKGSPRSLYPVCKVFRTLVPAEKCAKEHNGKIYLRMELHGVFE